MLVDLDTNELWYLLERCLHGSHLRSDTIERFVNEFYNKLSEHQRMNLFEWAVRLGYAWNGKNHFEPDSSCCGDYYVNSHKRCAPEFITNIEHLDLSAQWQEHQVQGVDYDQNILEPCRPVLSSLLF